MSSRRDSWKDDAHDILTRAWKQFKKGDLERAEKTARKALVTDPESADAQLLLGQIVLGRGDPQGAFERFKKAIELDPDRADPYLCAAEVALYELDDPDEAVELATEVLERADDQAEYTDALLLRVEALLAMEDKDADDEARDTLRDLQPTLADPAMAQRAGWVLLELKEHERAERYFRQAIERDPKNADAWHGLGLCAEARGDDAAMLEAWLTTRELDLQAPSPAWSLSEEEFEQVAAAALDELPEHIRKRLANVPILARDYPDPDIIRQGFDPRLLGFFSGVPYPDKGSVGGQPPHLDCILLFKRNIERLAASREEAIEEMRITLLHETGHFFALSEKELEEMGLG